MGQQSEEAKPEAKGGSRLSNNLTTSRKSGYGLKSHHVSVSRGDAKKLRDLLAGNNPSQLRLHRNNDGYPSTPSGGEIKSRAEGSGHQPSTLKTMPNRKPLYQQLQMRDALVERESLEEKKKRLEEIRAFHKPIEKKDMMDHALKYEKIRMQKDHENKQKRKAEIIAERQRRENLPTFTGVRQSSDDMLDHLRSPGGILGIEK